ncbi:hypothetical protein HAX54_025606, partial [Datura stramonium]|nr:hypothetical protein [Datura stramonium]
ASQGHLKKKQLSLMPLLGLTLKKKPSIPLRIDEGLLTLEFLAIREMICELRAGYILNEPERCNLTLLKEFYANWETSFEKSTKVKIRGQ